MSDLFGNHIVGFPMRRPIYLPEQAAVVILSFIAVKFVCWSSANLCSLSGSEAIAPSSM